MDRDQLSQPQLWLRRFSQERLHVESYASFLSKPELDLVQRRATQRLQEDALMSFALRRDILARLLKTSPSILTFDYSAHQKPFLLKNPLYFNVSHSEDFWIMLTDFSHPVGVDVENTQREVECINLAKRFFTQKESLLVESAPHPATVFWHLWTGKEALLKATGVGIGDGLDKAEILWDEQKNVYFIVNEALATTWRLHWFLADEHMLVATATVQTPGVYPAFSAYE